MEVDRSNPTVFYASRIFGLAPYLLVETGQLRQFKLSILLCLYSVLMLLTTGKFTQQKSCVLIGSYLKYRDDGVRVDRSDECANEPFKDSRIYYTSLNTDFESRIIIIILY